MAHGERQITYIGPRLPESDEAVKGLYHLAIEGSEVSYPVGDVALRGLDLAECAANELKRRESPLGDMCMTTVRDRRYQAMTDPRADLTDMSKGLLDVYADWSEGRPASIERLAIAHQLATDAGLYEGGVSRSMRKQPARQVFYAALAINTALHATRALCSYDVQGDYEPDEAPVSQVNQLALGQDELARLLGRAVSLDPNLVVDAFSVWADERQESQPYLPATVNKPTINLLERFARFAEHPNREARLIGMAALIGLRDALPTKRAYKRRASGLVAKEMLSEIVRLRPRFDDWNDKDDKLLYQLAMRSGRLMRLAVNVSCQI